MGGSDLWLGSGRTLGLVLLAVAVQTQAADDALKTALFSLKILVFIP